MNRVAAALARAAPVLAAGVVALAVCFALAQWVGRGVAWQLPRLESVANRVLAPWEVRVGGLEGRWRGINPGVFMARLEVPAGQVAGLDFELDLLESIWRQRIVARRLTVADGHLLIARTAAGWRLPGAGDGSFDVVDFLRHSDEVWVRGQLRFEDGPRAETLDVEAMVVNRDRQHRFFFYLHSGSGCAECALTVSGDVDEAGGGAVRLESGRFAVSQPLLSVLGLSRAAPTSAWRNMHLLVDLDGDWVRDDDGVERARLASSLRIDGTTGAAGTVQAHLAAWRRGAGYRGRVETLKVASDGSSGSAVGAFAAEDLGGPGWGATLWFPKLQLAPMVAAVAAMMGAEHPGGRWLAAVAPEGRFRDLAFHFDNEGVAIQGRGSEGALHGHKGVPSVAGLAFSLRGHPGALRLGVAGRELALAFPGHIPAAGPYRHGSATLTFAFAPPYIGMRTADAQLSTGSSLLDVALAVARPIDPTEVRVAADARVDRMAVAVAREYLPTGLEPTLRDWLLAATGAGDLAAGRVAYRGHARTRGGWPMRRLELTASVQGASLDYHPEWPPASGFDGALTITGGETRLAGAARAFGIQIDSIAVQARRNADRVAVRLAGDADLAQLFAFARETPVRRSMAFLSDAWNGSGAVRFEADLKVPLRAAALRPDDIRLDLILDGATVDLADIGLRFDGVHKNVAFAYPVTVAGASTQGRLFGAPARIAIASDPAALRIDVAGSATPADVYRLLDTGDLGIAEGRFDFDASLTVFTASDRAVELHVASELAGLSLALPAPLGKAAATPRPLRASLQFLNARPGDAAGAGEATVAVSASYGAASGWLHVGDGIDGGAIGIGAPVPMIDAGIGRLVLAGGIDAITATELATLMAAPVSTALDWELRDFRLGRLGFDAATFENLTIDAQRTGGELAIAVEGPALAGTATRQGGEPWQIDIRRLLLPARGGDHDPFDAGLIGNLVAADVTLRQVAAGPLDYGSWRFAMRPDEGGVALLDVVADVRGLRIESAGDGHLYWAPTGTRFEGRVTAGDLRTVLPQWGFAESVVSESFVAEGRLRWPGSPVNFDLAHLTGEANLELVKGSFLDVAPSGTRIMSLINFSTIVKRISLDFSDVFGRGVAFERVLADLAVDDGLARFTKPGEVIGTGSSFLISGTVDLDAGDLNNELVVTVPLLTSNLPWYAAFLAFSNPAGAAGVWLGRQVFKDQLKRLSSGKYRVGGTYDEPKVEFLSIFDNDIDLAPSASAAPADPEADPRGPTPASKEPH